MNFFFPDSTSLPSHADSSQKVLFLDVRISMDAEGGSVAVSSLPAFGPSPLLTEVPPLHVRSDLVTEPDLCPRGFR